MGQPGRMIPSQYTGKPIDQHKEEKGGKGEMVSKRISRSISWMKHDSRLDLRPHTLLWGLRKTPLLSPV